MSTEVNAPRYNADREKSRENVQTLECGMASAHCVYKYMIYMYQLLLTVALWEG